MTYHHSRARVGSDDFVLRSAGNCSLAGIVPEAHGIDTVLVSNPGAGFNQRSRVAAAGMYIAATVAWKAGAPVTRQGEAVAPRLPYYQNGATHTFRIIKSLRLLSVADGPSLRGPLGLCC